MRGAQLPFTRYVRLRRSFRVPQPRASERASEAGRREEDELAGPTTIVIAIVRGSGPTMHTETLVTERHSFRGTHAAPAHSAGALERVRGQVYNNNNAKTVQRGAPHGGASLQSKIHTPSTSTHEPTKTPWIASKKGMSPMRFSRNW